MRLTIERRHLPSVLLAWNSRTVPCCRPPTRPKDKALPGAAAVRAIPSGHRLSKPGRLLIPTAYRAILRAGAADLPTLTVGKHIAMAEA